MSAAVRRLVRVAADVEPALHARLVTQRALPRLFAAAGGGVL